MNPVGARLYFVLVMRLILIYTVSAYIKTNIALRRKVSLGTLICLHLETK